MAFDYARFGPAAGQALRANAGRLSAAAAHGLRPPPRMSPAEWAEANRRFPDDAPYPGRYRHDRAPELVEIHDALAEDDPCEEIGIGKCAQSGGSVTGENWLGFISDLAPGPVLFVQATFKAALDWAAEKFWPMVWASPKLNPEAGGTIKPLGTPDGDGSTKVKIRFAHSNGYILLAGANSAASLRQRTVRYAIEDDLDQFPDDLDGQGSPETMIDNRLKVYRRQGQSKRLKISTYTVKGSSKIGLFMGSADRRRFRLKCPGCGSRFVPVWQDIAWPDGKPEEAYLVAPCCGVVVEHWQKASLKLADGWLSETIEGVKPPRVLTEDEFQALRERMPRSRRRGFELHGLISSFQTWADMAVRFLACAGDLNKLKAWTNLDLGEEFEAKGSTPDYEKLRELREQDWSRLVMPYGPCVVTVGVDVQGDGLYLETVGWAENAESWSLDQRFLPGATDVMGEGAWADLETYTRRRIAYPGGRSYPLDQVCVDAGYHTAATETFCRSRPNRLPVFGRAGWTLPILGRGQHLRYERQGRKVGQGSKAPDDKAYLVGTFGAKLAFYGYLRATLKAAADELAGAGRLAPRGRCHFNKDAPDEWFEHVTSETIVTTTVNGYPKREWKPLPGRPNHWLDCRVYNYAAAEKLMLDTLTPADWAALRAERCGPADPAQGDLLERLTRPALAAAAPSPPADSPPPAATNDVRQAVERPWIDPLLKDWL